MKFYGKVIQLEFMQLNNKQRMWQKIMRWEVQYPEPKGPAPFDNYDLIVCLGFAYGYTMSILGMDFVFFIIIELLWGWFTMKRVKR